MLARRLVAIFFLCGKKRATHKQQRSNEQSNFSLMRFVQNFPAKHFLYFISRRVFRACKKVHGVAQRAQSNISINPWLRPKILLSVLCPVFVWHAYKL